MSSLTKLREAIWRAWQKEAIAHGITPPAKFWAERAAVAVVDLLKEADRDEPGSKRSE
jgi:hypothetical protein